jgi:hypothetical protein
MGQVADEASEQLILLNKLATEVSSLQKDQSEANTKCQVERALI